MRPGTFLILTFLLVTGACTRPLSTLAPEPAPTSGMRPCGAADLQTSSSSNSIPDALMLGVTLINQTGTPCVLDGRPQITLTDHGRPLDLRIEDAQGVPPATLSIAPGESLIAILTWRNYCGETLNDLVIHLALAAGESLDIQTDLNAAPGCDAPGEPSTLTINPYSYPP
jgi:hypothetical protein